MKEKQENIDIGGEFSKMEKQIDAGFDGKITDIRIGNSSEMFGDKQKYDNRLGYIISVDVFMKGDNGESIKIDEFDTFFSKPKPQFINKSKIGAYKKKYGKYPDVNDEVRVIVDDNGFYQIEGTILEFGD